ncbi:starch synthase [Faunimonas pinastri]|uniref:Glycogen synthase n=1 Tax=Faunimonas pinastri TaxID=1855383 RepID=A0A1H8ZFJ8_9HYPH|nr:glycogen synthase GlgA [Faunimonas pinastri]SEP62997.1 starch synthase [Faunimonas pinastri]
MSDIQVLAVASEIYPLVKTGGLGDVMGAMPGPLAAEGIRIRTLVPGYPSVLEGLGEGEAVYRFDNLFGGPARLLAGSVLGLDLFVLDAPHLFARDGNPYVGPEGHDWPDNPIRFAALARVAASLGKGLLPAYSPDVIHAHDWQTGLMPAYLHYDGGPRPRTVITIHNLAFQGQCPAELLGALGLPDWSYNVEGVEHYGGIGFLKAGLQFADRITTVSPTYADEIRGPELGMGLDGLLRNRSDVLSGILNGIDEDVWNPVTDPLIAARYSTEELTGKRLDKVELQARLGLSPEPDTMLFGIVSRLTWQKGLDLLLETLPALLEEGAQLAIVGEGDAGTEDAVRRVAAEHPGRVACFVGYDEGLAHLLQAGSDALLAPSRFEPCGLTQLYALRYGAVPVVSRVGGLADTVDDATPEAIAANRATGVQFSPVNATELGNAIRRAAALYRDRPTWQGIQRAAMRKDVSWRTPSRRYAELYRQLLAEGPAN